MSFEVFTLGEHRYKVSKDFYSVQLELIHAIELISKLDEQLGLNPPQSQGEPNFIHLGRKLLSTLTHMDSKSMQMLMHTASRDQLVDIMRTVKGSKLENRLMTHTTKRNRQAIQTDVLYNQPIKPVEALRAYTDFFALVERLIETEQITLVDPDGEYY
ncbi:FliG C-terminal domain-containing protein [Oceanospirillum sp.]|uniref:FliG C-terminal domain-containing protein n=1 Tax=Oceanospirillum sp. TaxID=2021254 RepID=UPI003A92088A